MRLGPLGFARGTDRSSGRDRRRPRQCPLRRRPLRAGVGAAGGRMACRAGAAHRQCTCANGLVHRPGHAAQFVRRRCSRERRRRATSRGRRTSSSTVTRCSTPSASSSTMTTTTRPSSPSRSLGRPDDRLGRHRHLLRRLQLDRARASKRLAATGASRRSDRLSHLRRRRAVGARAGLSTGERRARIGFICQAPTGAGYTGTLDAIAFNARSLSDIRDGS